VANPFLAVAGLIAWLAAFRWALTLPTLHAACFTALALVGTPCLLQYHCLDCGATGLLFRWKSHACERVRDRQELDRVRRFRGPNPTIQMILWAYLLAGVAVLAVAVGLALRD
jgi:hypothetical protein